MDTEGSVETTITNKVPMFENIAVAILVILIALAASGNLGEEEYFSDSSSFSGSSYSSDEGSDLSSLSSASSDSSSISSLESYEEDEDPELFEFITEDGQKRWHNPTTDKEYYDNPEWLEREREWYEHQEFLANNCDAAVADVQKKAAEATKAQQDEMTKMKAELEKTKAASVQFKKTQKAELDEYNAQQEMLNAKDASSKKKAAAKLKKARSALESEEAAMDKTEDSRREAAKSAQKAQTVAGAKISSANGCKPCLCQPELMMIEAPFETQKRGWQHSSKAKKYTGKCRYKHAVWKPYLTMGSYPRGWRGVRRYCWTKNGAKTCKNMHVCYRHPSHTLYPIKNWGEQMNSKEHMIPRLKGGAGLSQNYLTHYKHRNGWHWQNCYRWQKSYVWKTKNCTKTAHDKSSKLTFEAPKGQKCGLTFKTGNYPGAQNASDVNSKTRLYWDCGGGGVSKGGMVSDSLKFWRERPKGAGKQEGRLATFIKQGEGGPKKCYVNFNDKGDYSKLTQTLKKTFNPKTKKYTRKWVGGIGKKASELNPLTLDCNGKGQLFTFPKEGGLLTGAGAASKCKIMRYPHRPLSTADPKTGRKKWMAGYQIAAANCSSDKGAASVITTRTRRCGKATEGNTFLMQTGGRPTKGQIGKEVMNNDNPGAGGEECAQKCSADPKCRSYFYELGSPGDQRAGMPGRCSLYSLGQTNNPVRASGGYYCSRGISSVDALKKENDQEDKEDEEARVKEILNAHAKAKEVPKADIAQRAKDSGSKESGGESAGGKDDKKESGPGNKPEVKADTANDNPEGFSMFYNSSPGPYGDGSYVSYN